MNRGERSGFGGRESEVQAEVAQQWHGMLSLIWQRLNDFDVSELGGCTRQAHTQVSNFCSDLLSRCTALLRLQMRQQDRIAEKVDFSQEQQAAVMHPGSLFLQGRSGTGKTLVLVKRMHARAKLECRSGLAQLYITKSSLLCGEVSRQLAQAGHTVHPLSECLTGTVVCTWTQLVEFLIGPKHAAVNFQCFQACYWPCLKPVSRGLSAHLVWCEFCTRLRPFDGAMEGLSLPEYLLHDVSAYGIEITEVEQKAIHTMFRLYTSLKHKLKQSDDVDIALHVCQRIGRHSHIADRVYVDEAQDFAPVELTVLICLCRLCEGISIAGDTCQTINPGSAFSFAEVRDAFCRQKPLGAGTCCIRHLSYNYRCAASIASLGNSVTRALLSRFPRSADHINEAGVPDLSPTVPLFLDVAGQSPAILLSGLGCSPDAADLASSFAVIVRDDVERDRLLKDGVRGTILTVPESKGLEFDLVVLCGLLGGCPEGASIWALVDSMSEQSRRASDDRVDPFSRKRLVEVALGIQELKALYVAISRARVGCLLLEHDPDPIKWATISLHWDEQGLVERWVGLKRCMIGAAVSNGVEVGSRVPRTKQAMLAVLDRERSLRRGPFHADARKTLGRELARLRQEPLDPGFVDQFQASFGEFLVFDDAEGLESLPNVVKPLLSMMRTRYRAGLAPKSLQDTVRTLYARGMNLLAHATDNLRDRWRLLQVSRRTLKDALALIDGMLWEQMETDVEQQTTSSREFAWMLGAVFVEVARPYSWRGGSSLCKLRRFDLWKHIFSFLVPVDASDLSIFAKLVAQRVHSRTKFLEEVRASVTLSWAWATYAGVQYCFDANATDQESAKRAEERGCKVALSQLVASTEVRRAAGESAGHAFLSLQQYARAGQAFGEAGRTLGQLGPWVRDRHVQDMEGRFRSCHVKAAASFLVESRLHVGDESAFLSRAAREFWSAMMYDEAIVCAWAAAARHGFVDARATCACFVFPCE